MFDGLKSLAGVVMAAAVAFLAALAAKRVAEQHRLAQDYEKLAEDMATGQVRETVLTANQALSQAKLAEARAAEAKRKAEARLDRLARSDETLADIVERWQK